MGDGQVTTAKRLMTSTVAGALNWIARWYNMAGPLAPRQIAAQVVDMLIDGLAARTNVEGEHHA